MSEPNVPIQEQAQWHASSRTSTDTIASTSRSASRRRRRQDQRKKSAKAKASTGETKAVSQAMTTLPEEHRSEENWMQDPTTQDTTEVQPFAHTKPPSRSMDGPSQHSETTQGADRKLDAQVPMNQDGLKLRLELNLDIEIELKAHIHGDITLALL